MRYFASGFRQPACVAGVLIVALSATTSAQQLLTLDEAVELAAARSQQLVAQDAAARAARELAVAARRAPDPSLTVGIENLPIDGEDKFSLTRDFMTMRSIGLMRELTRGDKRDARAIRFERQAEAEDARRTVAIADLKRGAATAWLDRYYLERAHEMLARQHDEAVLQIEAADLAFRSGLESQSEALAARSAVAKIDDRIAENDRDIEVATIELERWIGDAAKRPLGEPPPIATVALASADFEGELTHHPQLALMLKQEEIARAEAEIARTNKRSDWTIEVMYSQRGPDYSDMVSVNFSKPLQWGERNRQDRELSAKLAIANRLRAEREEETREHVAEGRALLQKWQRNGERLGHYSTTLIPLGRERTTATTAAYRGGTRTLAEVLDARLAEIETQLDYLALQIETAELWAQLNYLVPADHRVTHASIGDQP